jgi:hypothetical protein
MPANPAVGRAGGQEYDVARAIRTFLEQMAGGGISFGAAVIKELIQNADDAGASELVLTLDERSPADLPAECNGYGPLLEPALLVRNNAHFRIAGEVPAGDQDDFTAICEVAGGHKRFNPTAAGRFGIGFNSVYFLTDTPLLFSRREVHVFDLRRLMFTENGWRFSLDEFPANAGNAGPIKPVLEWTLPKAVLAEGAFQELAAPGRDYRQTVFRLPLRRTLGGSSMEKRGPVFPSASFPDEADRNELLREMCEEARRSLLFLKSLHRVVFGGIVERHFEPWACVEATRRPATNLEEFVTDVRRMEDGSEQARPLECSFRCDISVEVKSERIRVTSGSAAFQVTHAADFTNSDLVALAEKLRKNGERAVPWVAIGAPLDARSFDWEGAGNARWRVFLPLVEEGPCASILNGALFVDPSRRAVEFRTEGSDESLRKSQWNRALVEHLLVPLLRNASGGVIESAPDLIENDPKKYLSLFPTAWSAGEFAASLADVVREAFGQDLWLLELYDLWRKPFTVLVGPEAPALRLERVPEWLVRYKDAFEELSTDSRRFVAWNVGDAVGERLGDEGTVEVDKPAADLADNVLLADAQPQPRDLERLLKLLGDTPLEASIIEGRWAFQRAGTEESLLRFCPATLYLVRTGETCPVYEALEAIGISFDQAEWVASEVGVCALRSDRVRDLTNLSSADDAGALELLRRVGRENQHDRVTDHHAIVPIVDFLCAQNPHRLPADLRLAFLVKTAAGVADRRRLGVLFLRPERPTPEEEDLWQGFLRQAFAQVDPQFAAHLRRAVAHAPLLLTSLGDDNCSVRLARGDLLDLLHEVCARAPGFIRQLAAQFSGVDGEGPRPEAHRAGRLLLREADRRWDTLDEDLRATVLALPIHRTASGTMISLSSTGDVGLTGIPNRYFLQSQDDLSDAPVELPAGQLLHSLDPDVRSFYRRRVEIREQGRVEVLKECLRQLGADATRSSGILNYVAKYYRDTVEQLRERSGEGAADIRELDQLYDGARGIPCLDGSWQRATECVEANDLLGILARQGWQQGRIGDLVCQLVYPRPVAEASSETGELAQTLWKVEKLDRDVLAELAITSESPDLPLRDRAKVIRDNLRFSPGTPPPRAKRINQEICRALGGPVEFAELVLVDTNEAGVSNDVVRAVLPEAADLPRMARDLTGGDVSAAETVLRALGVPIVNAEALLSRVIGGFAGIWRQLRKPARIALLAWLGRQNTLPPPDALSLDTVLVGEGEGEWAQPADVIAPSFARLVPPNVPVTRIARTEEIPREVLRLWNQWCGLRDLNAVVASVVRATSDLPRGKWPAASLQFARWLEHLVEQHGAQAVADALRNLPWVLSRRGTELEFHRPADVLDDEGAEVLQHKFWVVHDKIPAPLSGLAQTRRLTGTHEVLELVAQCLASAASARAKAAESVYELLLDFCSDERAADLWRRLSWSQPVYRLFRSADRQPDRLVLGKELFLGDKDHNEDFGQALYCFAATDDIKKRVRQLYRTLGVGGRPTAGQLVSALACIPGEARTNDVHGRLVDALTQAEADNEDVPTGELRSMKVRTCAKSFEPLSRCYRDPELGRPSRLSAVCRNKVVDGRDSANRQLLKWLDDRFPGTVQDLRSAGTAELMREPDEVHESSANVLDAWRDWLGELVTPGSLVQEEVEKLGFEVPSEPIRLHVVRKIDVRFCLPDGIQVLPSDEWAGPELFHDSHDRLLVRADIVDRDFVGQSGDVEALDERITDTLEELLRRRTSVEKRPAGSLRDALRSTLERPAAVLKRMKEEKQEHFFHQYLDQTADPEFSNLFDTYRRTATAAKEKRSAMAAQMWDLISLRFVDARRQQIRGYGYDEFAIFAELVQNAEDAYAARETLGLPNPPARDVTFTYSNRDGLKILTASHYGRPFNMWRHGTKRVEAFRYDVEGVLKSAGSFKPHSATDGARPIGRFGLGFKSVYLVTDAPRIHSGDWHFEITAGCIPNEIPVPADDVKGLTKIVLPLTPDAREERDSERGRFANLLPFLRQVDEVRIQQSDGNSLELKVTSQGALRTADEYLVDRVEVAGASHVPGGVIRLLRVRHPRHERQLGVLLGPDGLPVAWTEALDSDVFAVLPLRVRLGCGVGVSNLFEVQSGRTHLIDPVANDQRITEVAESLRAVTKALMADDVAASGEVMSRFWSLWRWDRGDEEASNLRLQLARELALLVRNAAIVPTLNPEHCVKIGEGVLFSFESIPEDFTNELLQQSVEFSVDGRRVALHRGNVVPEPIRSAVEKVYAAAKEQSTIAVSRIGWSELGEVFLARPWLAERPELVSAMAHSLPSDKIDKVRQWLGKCLFRAAKGQHMQLADLLPPRFPGAHQLPLRLLDLLDESYDEEAVSLLKQVGLPSRPPLETMKAWVRSGLDQRECCDLLRYLSDAGRWRRDYYELGQLLVDRWFEADGVRLSTAEAVLRGFVHLEELDPDPAFRAWLGINTGAIQINLEASRWDRPVSDPKGALEKIWSWWSGHSAEFVTRYDQRTYPDGKPPRLDVSFSDRDSLQRQSWLSLMMLASLQTMGRTNPEQHRNFLRRCAQRGWMEVFADPLLPADGWIRVLEDYLGAQAYDIPFYNWVRQFVSIYQIARWLPEYVWSFLAIDKFTQRFDLDRVTRPATNPDFAGGGPSAPPLTRALGIGACFVVRELVRTGVLKKDLAHEHAYVAIGRVRYVFARLGMAELQGEGASYRHSSQIHRFLLNHIGPDRAHFERCFDLPFLAIAEDADLQSRFLECQLPPDYEEFA